MGAIERALRSDGTARTPVLETPNSALSRHVTVYVLLAGVLGGLLLVLLVLCCCKICCRPSKQLTRQPVLFTKYPSDRQSNSSRDSRKYKSLDPTVTIDLETSCGYSENSASPRDHDDKSADVQPSATDTCSSPRLFADPITGMPEVHKVIDKVPPIPVTFITQRSPDDLSFMMSPHSPRSPPFLRQSSICLDSNEQLERLDSLCEQAPTNNAPTSPIAGPSRSPDSIFIIEVPTDDDEEEDENETKDTLEGDNMTVVGQQDLSSESPSPDTRPTCTRVAAEVHDAPLRFHKDMDDDDDDDDDMVMSPVVGPSGTCSPPRPTSPLGEVPDSDDEVERRRGRKDSVMAGMEEEEDMKRALGVGARMGAESVLQRTASTESGALVVMMEERRRLLIRQDGTQQESDEEDEEPRAKVRYNDTGSLEEVDARADALLGLFVDDSDSPPGLEEDDDDDDDGEIAAAITTVAGYETLQEDGEEKDEEEKEAEAIRQEEEARQRALLREQYRELWQLRTTLEIEGGEDVEASGGTSSETSPEQEQPPTAVANGETKTPEDEKCSPEDEPPASRPPPLINPANIPTTVPEDDDDTPDSPMEPPTPEQQARLQERRESYKSILTRRLQQRRASAGAGGGTPNSSADNSLEESASPSASAETGDSMEGGSSTDASRLTAGTTTSFESSTDTGDSASAVGGVDGMAGGRLQQMKADSGYKSLEADGKHPRLSHRQIPVTDATDSKDEGVSVDFEASVDSERAPSVACSARSDETPATQDGDEDKTDTQPPPAMTTSTVIISSITTNTTVIPSSVSMTEVRAISPSSSSVLDDEPAKSSVFARFFRSGRGDRPHHHHHHHPSRLFSRDYSIDEKSDALFREFSRLDPAFETETGLRCRSPRSHARHRSLHHQRSADPDHTGSPRHRRRLSQQDNIEEEIRLEVLSSPAPSGDSQSSPGSAIPLIKVGLEEEASV